MLAAGGSATTGVIPPAVTAVAPVPAEGEDEEACLPSGITSSATLPAESAAPVVPAVPEDGDEDEEVPAAEEETDEEPAPAASSAVSPPLEEEAGEEEAEPAPVIGAPANCDFPIPTETKTLTEPMIIKAGEVFDGVSSSLLTEGIVDFRRSTERHPLRQRIRRMYIWRRWCFRRCLSA